MSSGHRRIAIGSIVLVSMAVAMSSGVRAQTGVGVDAEEAAEWGVERTPGQTPSIPMNADDPTWNAWQAVRDNLMEGREPGPFNPQRYHFGMAWQGIQTFFKQPIALTQEDLEAGNVDVAVLGAYTDMGTGMRGASRGPGAIRACCVYGGWGAVSTPHMGTGIDPFQELTVVDYGRCAQ